MKGGSKHTLTPPAYFQGVKTPNPHDLRPWTRPAAALLKTRYTVYCPTL